MAKQSRVRGVYILTVPCLGNHRSTRSRCATVGVGKVRTTKLEQRALSLLNIFEKAGKTVSRVSIEGRRIELVLSKEDSRDEFDRIDMRHDKT